VEGTLGEIRIFAGNYAPENWLFCQGQILPINPNQALYSILGTTYGGNGTQTFGLPTLPPVVEVAGAPNSMQYIICVRGYYPVRP
jgi:microcystin-dependent protein